MILMDGQRSCTVCASPKPSMLPGILDVGAHKRDVGSGFQDFDGLVGIQGFNWRVAGVFHNVDRAHAKHDLVLDEENDGWNA